MSFQLLIGVLSILCLTGLLLMADAGALVSTVKGIRWPWLGAAFFFFLAGNVIRVKQFRASVPSLRQVNGFDLFALVNIHKFANHVFPARSGELTYVYLVKKYLDQKVSAGLSSLLLVRVVELVTLLLMLGGAGIFMASRLKSYEIRLPWLWILVLLTASLCALFFMPRLIKAAVKALDLLPRGFSSRRLVAVFKQMLLEVHRELSGGSSYFFTLALTAVYSTMVWAALFAMFVSVFLSMRINIGFEEVIVGSMGAIIVNALPVNAFGSIGTFEAGWTAGFVAVGVGFEAALAAGMILHALVIAAGGALSLLGWIYLNRRDIITS